MKRADFDHAFALDQMPFDQSSRYPEGDSIYFECSLCGDIVPSRPIEAAECSCGNLVVDSDARTLKPRRGHGTVLVLHAQPRRD